MVARRDGGHRRRRPRGSGWQEQGRRALRAARTAAATRLPKRGGAPGDGPAVDRAPEDGPTVDRGGEPSPVTASVTGDDPGDGSDGSDGSDGPVPASGAAPWWAPARRLRPRYPRPDRAGWRRWLPSLRQGLLLCTWSLLALLALIGWAYETTSIPSDLNAYATQQDNVYYWADGTEMARVGPVDRQAMPLDRIPVSVRSAVLAAENASFYSDAGVSPKGIARAVMNMATGGQRQGGSTITQQYVKNVYLDQDQTISRKVSEIFIAVKLDRKMSKDRILDGYLNTSWFGRGAYGVQRAAKAYYGKDVSQLDTSQSAFLAALLKGAGQFDPSVSAANHQRAVARWNWVLDRMVETGKLSAARRATLTTFPEPIAPPKPVGLSGQTGYLVDTARAYVSAHSGISDQQFDRGGYQIYTTFEKPKVDALASAVKQQTAKLHPSTRAADRDVRVGAASVATDGRILALYGGPDYIKQGFDDADISIVPAGTAYAPYVYAAALRDGVVSARDAPRVFVGPQSPYDGDDDVPIQTPEGPYWSRDGKVVKTANAGDRSYGTIPLAQAVADGVNGPIMQVGMDVGLNRVRQASIDAGLLPDSGFAEQVPSFSLGTSTPSPIRMAAGYTTFAAGGTRTDPYSVLRVTRDGSAVALQKPAVTHPFTPKVAGEVDDALREAVSNGAAHAVAKAGPGLAGLPGTAPDNTSASFVGYDADMATAVTLFRIDPKTQQLEPLTGIGGRSAKKPGSDYPTAVWTHYAEAVRPPGGTAAASAR
ncbi:putative penicillin-binding protein [Actinacidiphila reveromycinica]|uniref:Putative penicillin-binding protein n=1 Tax=Actinacidiphila reveromycinica TaxID=659352 RepID=A0A7U3UU15_9ACTN|nr:transglycosylase domain-containing protein [Streptomyces sp. SN-593]BBA98882.1 putative penicillin-binding protein [Streptomyces sp. SN-593]